MRKKKQARQVFVLVRGQCNDVTGFERDINKLLEDDYEFYGDIFVVGSSIYQGMIDSNSQFSKFETLH